MMLCKHFSNGYCSNGDACQLQHGEAESKPSKKRNKKGKKKLRKVKYALPFCQAVEDALPFFQASGNDRRLGRRDRSPRNARAKLRSRYQYVGFSDDEEVQFYHPSVPVSDDENFRKARTRAARVRGQAAPARKVRRAIKYRKWLFDTGAACDLTSLGVSKGTPIRKKPN